MTARIVPADFYVYTHAKATTGEVFYGGKGHGKRAWRRVDRSGWWRRVVAKHGLNVAIVQDGLQEWAAFELERDLIALYGRRDQGLGPLVNITDGGEGACGAVLFNSHTEAAEWLMLRRKVAQTTRLTTATAAIGKAVRAGHRAYGYSWTRPAPGP